MTSELKQHIVDAALDYISLNKLSQNDVCRATRINSGYLSNMLKGQFINQVAGKDTAISDKWFAALADYVGFSIKKSNWQTFLTPQFLQIAEALETAKNEGFTRMLIGPTGCGKTYAVDAFCRKFPSNTFRVTISSVYRLPDLVNELIDKLGIEMTLMGSQAASYSVKTRIDRIVDKLKEINRQGGHPILIIDEGENMEYPLMKAIKGLYDNIKDHCAIVLIGTQRLPDRMLNQVQGNRGRHRNSLPELYRRFKAGHHVIEPVDETFELMLNKYVPEAGLRRLLCKMCLNYGELHDFLQPVLKEADRAGVAVSERLFRTMFNIHIDNTVITNKA